MALNSSWSTTARNAAHASGLTPEYAGAKFRGYNGTRPSNADTALSGNTLLFEATCGTPAFGSPSAGLATANAITQDSSADATGTCTFVRVFKADGTTVLEDLEVGTTGCNVNLSSTSIVSGQPVSISSWSHTVPQSGT